MAPQTFKNRVIATAGPLPDELTDENIKRWTELRKGRFSKDFDETVTHLLCTREQFNKKHPRVKEALKRGKRFHIVHYDWFLHSTTCTKRQNEREYSMRNILAERNARKREQARIARGIKEGEKSVNTNLFHIYIDRDFFSYQIDLNRDDEANGENGQRYTLCLWESDAKPHLYWFTAKFLKKKGDNQPSYHRPSPCSGKWRVEMNHFLDFFRIKTGIIWEDRVIKEKTTSKSFFQYTTPTGGKPVGRRLRFAYDYCRQVNAEIRGLPWPPEPKTPPVEADTNSSALVQTEAASVEINREELSMAQDDDSVDVDEDEHEVEGDPNEGRDQVTAIECDEEEKEGDVGDKVMEEASQTSIASSQLYSGISDNESEKESLV